ncbi:TPA: EpsG family protein [Klebsiella variicola subsp. variicola]|uniref:EpsG family protein n=1 Tax=Klebsiella variicola TaxID=244366 RepID=UPI002B05F64F|nr:EpsG family protein [Klebsiella variicola]
MINRVKRKSCKKIEDVMAFDNFEKEKIIFFSIFFIIFIMLAGISPLLGFYVPIIFLSVNIFQGRMFRVPLALIAVYSSLYIFASRNIVSGSVKDDFENLYFPVYNIMASGGSIFYYQFTSGVEFLLPLYFKILYNVFGIVDPVDVLVAVSALCIVPFYIWLEKYGLQGIDEDKKSLCIASSLGLFILAVTTQNMRQAVSCAFLLFAISYFLDKKRLLFVLFFILSITAHTTAIIILPIFLILLGNSSFKRNGLVLFALIASLLFSVFISIIISSGLLGAATYKLLFYSDMQSSGFEIGYLKYLIITCAAGLLYFSPNHKEYKNLLLYGTFIYAVLAPIPVVSHRLLLLMVAFLNGYLMFLAFYRITFIYRFILVFYCLYRIIKIGPYFDNTSLDDEKFMNLWYSFPWAGDYFFYYLK